MLDLLPDKVQGTVLKRAVGPVAATLDICLAMSLEHRSGQARNLSNVPIVVQNIVRNNEHHPQSLIFA